MLVAVGFADTAAQIYHNMSAYPVLGTLAPDAAQRFTRLPDSLKTRVGENLWGLGQNSAGMAIRFASDATTINAKWKSLNNFAMNHMAPTGVKGIDLYTLMPDNSWAYVGTGIPKKNGVNSATLAKDMAAGGMREYMLFLPLYDGVADLEIGVNPGAAIKQPSRQLPSENKPVVMYGTSIMQGGCASRPGMAHTNILQRRLNREIVNLGFSGAAKLEPEIAHLMAQCDAGAYVIDVLPNSTVKSIGEKLPVFYRILRYSHPATPIVLVENPMPPRARFDIKRRKQVEILNESLREFYNSMVAAGDTNIYYYESDAILPADGEGTVDGIHLTDYGFQHFAEGMYSLLSTLIRE